MNKSNKKEIAVEVRNIHKNFTLVKNKNSTLKQAMVNMVKKGNKTIYKVLDGVSFEVNKGDFFGIVGRNGSGKSTLLKILAGVYEPTSGSVRVNGKLVPFIELGVGFNPELSGRDNVFLNGALLGFNRKQMAAMYDEIVEFAELEPFMDQKLKNYSSGMQVRLAFSIAIKAQGDILVLDEVLAVGDEAFQRKCNDYFFKLKREKKTVILVTHSMESVRQFCSKAILVDNGKIIRSGNADKVASAYSDIFLNEYIQKVKDDNEQEKNNKNHKLSDLIISDIYTLQNNKRTRVVNFREDFSISVKLSSDNNYRNVTMGVHIIDQAGRAILALSTKTLKDYSIKKGENNIRFDIENIFTEGEYYLALAVETKEDRKLLIKESELARFSIIGLDVSKYSTYSLTHPNFKIVLNEGV